MFSGTLIIVPARGGSRRLPRKALRPVAGKPLLWYTFEKLRKANLLKNTIFVTDDGEYHSYVQSVFGAKVHRQQPISPGGEDMHGCVKEVVDAETRAGCKPFKVAIVNPCAPLWPISLLQESVRRLTTEYDASYTVIREPSWLYYCDLIEDNTLMRPREPEPVYHSSGCIVTVWPHLIDEPIPEGSPHWLCHRRKTPVLHDDPYCDVDTEEDLWRLEGLILGQRRKQQEETSLCTDPSQTKVA